MKYTKETIVFYLSDKEVVRETLENYLNTYYPGIEFENALRRYYNDGSTPQFEISLSELYQIQFDISEEEAAHRAFATKFSKNGNAGVPPSLFDELMELVGYDDILDDSYVCKFDIKDFANNLKLHSFMGRMIFTWNKSSGTPTWYATGGGLSFSCGVSWDGKMQIIFSRDKNEF